MITLDDNYKLEDFGVKALSVHQNPLTSDFNNKTVNIPGVPGRYDFGTEVDPKPFNITLEVVEKDKLLLQEKLNNFISFLVDDFGKPRPVKVIFNYEPDKFYTIKLNDQVDVDRIYSIGTFDLSFIAYNPYKYSTFYSDEVSWGSEVITFGSFLPLGHEGTAGETTITSNTTLDLLVSGLAIKPLIKINGSGNDVKLSVNGYEINLPNFTNASWEIDCDNYEVFKDEIDMFSEVELRDFILLPGNNSLNISGTNMNFDIDVVYRDKYM